MSIFCLWKRILQFSKVCRRYIKSEMRPFKVSRIIDINSFCFVSCTSASCSDTRRAVQFITGVKEKKEEERANVKWCNLFTIALKFYLNCLIIHALEEWSKT